MWRHSNQAVISFEFYFALSIVTQGVKILYYVG